MLQGRRGWIAPESYLSRWFSALREPLAMPDWPVEIKVGAGFSDAISLDKVERLETLLAGTEHATKLPDLLAGKTVGLSLHADFALVRMLRHDLPTAAWRLIGNSFPLTGAPTEDLGYKPTARGHSQLDEPTVYRLDAENRLMQDANGKWYCAGWDYSIIGRYIEELWEVEMREPVSYHRRIVAFRNAVKQAGKLPAGTRAVFVPGRAVTQYQKQLLEQAIRELSAIEMEDGYEVTLDGGFPGHTAGYLFEGLRDCTDWHLPADVQPPMQLDLLAA
jgi:hypothetical protein